MTKRAMIVEKLNTSSVKVTYAGVVRGGLAFR